MEEQTFILPVTLRNALLSYLMSRPYSEVHEGITALTALKPLQDVREEIE